MGKWVHFFDPIGSVLLAQKCSVDFPVSKLILKSLNTTQLVYETSTKPVAIQNLNLLYKKYLFSRDRKGVWVV
jgi:hypothetical protein